MKKWNKIIVVLLLLALVAIELSPFFIYAEDVPTGITINDEGIAVELEEGGLTDDEDLEETEEDSVGVNERYLDYEGSDGLDETGLLEDSDLSEDENSMGGLEKEDSEVGAERVKEAEEQEQFQTFSLMSTQETPNYVMATDADFEVVVSSIPGSYSTGSRGGYFRYIGTDEYVEIPPVIQGVRMSNYFRMFYNAPSTLKGVKSTNTNITSMRHTFENAQADVLDVSQIETSNVQRMTGMFYNNKATDIKGLENFNTSRVIDMEIMFDNSSARTLDLTSFDTSNVQNMTGMFRDTKATDIRGLDRFNTSKVLTMNGMFEGAKAKSVDLSGFNTSTVNTMVNMFKDSDFTSLDLRGFNTSSVTNMSGMFQGAKATSINTSTFNTEKVMNMSNMFENTRATSLSLGGFNTSSVTNIDRMFYGSHATVLDLSHFNTSRVTSMDEVFSHSLATTINVGGWDTRNVEFMNAMFMESRANVLDLSSFNTSRIINMSDMFRGARASNIRLDGFDTTYVINMENMFRDTSASELDLSSFAMRGVNRTDNMFLGSTTKEVVVRSKEDEDILNRTVGKPSTLTFRSKYVLATDDDFIGTINGSFQYVGTADYIEIPHTIRNVNVTSYRDMFANTGIKGVISTNSRVTDMSGMFRGSTSAELDVRTLNTTNVTNMSGMFRDSKAKEIDLRNFITDKVTNMADMFRGTSVNILDLGSFDMGNVSQTSSMFQGTSATRGYARSQQDLNKLNSSSNKPSGLVFILWGIQVEQTPKGWTNGSVGLQVKGESGGNTIENIELLNVKQIGRNLLHNGNFADKDNMYFWHGDVDIQEDERFGNVGYMGDNYVRWQYGFFDIKQGDVITVSFYAKAGSATYMDVALEGANVAYGQRVSLNNEWTYYALTFDIQGVGNQALRFYGNGTKYLANIKYEHGREATEWTPAPEDLGIEDVTNDTFTVNENGSYIFRVTDSSGDSRTVSYQVSNIDRVPPELEITKSTTGRTGQDVVLYIEASDALSGVKSITLPDGRVVSGTSAEYIATSNKDYTIKVEDNAGNTTTKSVTVDNIDRSIPLLQTSVSSTAWTRGSVDVTVTSDNNPTGLHSIIQENVPDEGRNLIVRTGEIKGMYLSISGNISVHNAHDTMKERIKVTPGETLSFSQKNSNLATDGGYFRWSWFDVDGNYVGRMPNISNSFQWVVPNNVHYIWVSYPKDSDPKVERGNKVTPFSLAPEDVATSGNSKVFQVTTNGLYTYKATYKDGNSSEVTVNITNIDKTAPELEVSGNPNDWVEDDEITLTLNAKDTQSGVKSITLPDGTVVSSSKATYNVTENGEYEFIVEDNVGNKATETVKVEYLMMRYFFYLYDAQNKPLKGAEFALLRDGAVHATSVSGDDGLVDFGKVPPTGRYTIRQTKAPDGYVVNPDEREVEVGDSTDPEEFISYPRGTVLPSTGTFYAVSSALVVVFLSLGIIVTTKKLKKVK